ncbi:MAG TPA: hypothetical protein VJ842_18570 [Pyrinomonadaceae bacterium]|nr:hypothetical protein [Pyrinomonadaceae bacterium]
MKFTSPTALALALLLSAAAATTTTSAQEKPSDKTKVATTTATAPNAPAAAAATPAKTSITAEMTPLELARAAFNAQGGEKFRNLKNMMLIGSVDLYAPNSTQSLTGKFGMIVAGEKLRQEVQSAIVSFQMIYDGERSYTSLRGMNLPPLTKFGLPVLAKFDQAGYQITALPDKKKQRAFRIADAEGNSTDFYVDVATGRIVRFEIPYNGLTFSFEYKSFKEVDGVLVPVSFAQKLAAPQGDFIAEFKVKEVKLNQDLPADAFKIPEQ